VSLTFPRRLSSLHLPLTLLLPSQLTGLTSDSPTSTRLLLGGSLSVSRFCSLPSSRWESSSCLSEFSKHQTRFLPFSPRPDSLLFLYSDLPDGFSFTDTRKLLLKLSPISTTATSRTRELSERSDSSSRESTLQLESLVEPPTESFLSVERSSTSGEWPSELRRRSSRFVPSRLSLDPNRRVADLFFSFSSAATRRLQRRHLLRYRPLRTVYRS